MLAARKGGLSVSHAHLRHLNPLPANMRDILARFDRVLIPELNSGQLRTILRAKYMVDAQGFNKSSGRPFSVAEVLERIRLEVARAVQES